MSVVKFMQECRYLRDYLKILPADVLDELFNYPAAALGIFRDLPKLAQHYVLRILYVDHSIHKEVVDKWVTGALTKEHLEVKEVLSSLKIWNETSMPGGLTGWILNHKFRHSLKIALLGGGRPWTNSSKMEPDAKARTVKDLDAYALERWEALLHFLTEKQQHNDNVSKESIMTLDHAGLMDNVQKGMPSISKEGFQFLLLDTASQVWFFIIKYLEIVESSYNLSLIECLGFIFSLSLSTLGKDYSTEGLSETMLLLVQHLRGFGLLNQRTRKSGRYYPTRLAINLFSGDRRVSLDTENQKTGFVIVETNYRLYAYTDSDLQLAIVGMFTEFLYRFPDLVVGVITRDSIRQALRNGITSDQIISFLNMHAHPKMVLSSGNPKCPLPPTVIDQIKLWEIERNRLTFTESVLYNQFLSQRDYEIVRDYAQEIGALLHSSDQRRTIVVHRTGHEDVRKFWKRHSKSN